MKLRVNVENDGQLYYVNDLNKFYARFDCHDYRKEHRALRDILNVKAFGENIDLRITEEGVIKFIFCINVNMPCDPDKVRAKLVKACIYQLVTISVHLFNLTVDTNTSTLPLTWKTPDIVKKNNNNNKTSLSSMNDLRPELHRLQLF